MSTYSTSSIPQGIAIYANATLFPVTAQDGEQAVAADTNTLYIYDTSVPGWQAVANPGAAIAIDALTGEVTATGPGVVAATISAGAVTNAKLAAMADNTVKGNKSGAPASPSDLALSNVTEAVSSVLTISNGSKTVVSAADLTIEVKQSSAVQSGYLSSGDWSTFSNKVSSVGATAPIASSGGTTPTISISQSGAATDGYLSSADWNTFNSKQPAGNYITALTSDVTATGPGSVAATVAFVGGKTSSEVATSVTDTQNATALSTASTLMERDGSGETALDGLSLDGSTSGAIKLQAAATTTNYTVKLPSAQGAASTFLQNDGSGNLAWTAVPNELPVQTGNVDKVLATNGTSATWQFAGLGSGAFSSNIILGRGASAGLGGNNIIISTGGSFAGQSDSVAIGAVVTCTGNNAIAIGRSAQGTAGNTVAVGYIAVATGSGNMALGANARATSGSNSVAVGPSAFQTSTNYGLAVGAESGGVFNVATGDFNTCVGAKSGTALNNTSATRNVFLGYYAGGRSTTQANEFFVDNQDRTTYANQQTDSLLYGTFNATVGSQRLRINAQVNLPQGEKHASLHGQVGTLDVITATVNNYYIGVDSSLAAKTVNLPAAATAGAGFVLSIKDEGGLAGTNNITIDANGAELIDGAATQPINANYGSLNLMCSGTAWFII